MDRGYLHLPLNPLRAFAITSRHKTFTAAARHMGVSQVAVSRQVSILEDYLNAQLFERGRRSIKLTQVGRVLSHEIAGLFDDLEAATRRVLEQENDNTIRLRIYPTTALYWLMPRLQKLKRRYPHYRVRLDTSVEPLNFRGTHLEVAIQFGRGEWTDTRSRRLMGVTLDAVCSPTYCATARLRAPQDLDPDDLLHSRYRRREWEKWLAAAGVDLDHQRGIEYDSSFLAYTAARSGIGVAIGQLEYLQDDLRSGALMRPFSMPLASEASLYVVWPTLISASTKIKHFVDWVLEEAGEEREFYKG